MLSKSTVASFAFAATLSLGSTNIAFAAMPAPAAMPAMDVSTIDCSSAASHMAAAMMAPAPDLAMLKTQDSDHAYTAAMKMMSEHGAMLAKIEMKCGKNAHAMADAQKMADALDYNYLVEEALQNEFTSP